MNDIIINNICKELNVSYKHCKIVLELLSEGNTIPFIARYRKELTGSMDEECIRHISDVYNYQENLLKRKEDVIRLISEKGLMNDTLYNDIMKCERLVDVEDIYMPYKEKKKTKASEAIKYGLESLADDILNGNNICCSKYYSEVFNEDNKCIEGACYIIAERISDDAKVRGYIRNYTYLNSNIICKKKKNSVDENEVYKIYYDFNCLTKNIKPYQVLAINRCEKEGICSCKIDVLSDNIINYINKKYIKKDNINRSIIEDSIIDSYNRLIKPSIERDIRSSLTDMASKCAIDNFMVNLENLLLTPPITNCNVLALDPGFRTGCKLAVLDKFGNLLDIRAIYPTEPKLDIDGSKKIVLELFNKYDINVVAIGNGTASRESEKFICECINESNLDIKYVMVSEAGASVYSASKLAIKEFPDLTVEKRSAVSIGRRLQDSLSELVKIEPKSIGVGMYQHDVKESDLDSSLEFVVMKCVNSVGVDINTASEELLSYISGLKKNIIKNIIDYRTKNGRINSRSEMMNIKGVSDKVYEQCIGFIRVNDSYILDRTSIHPESYDVCIKFLDKLGFSVDDISSPKLIDKLKNIDINKYVDELGVDKYTLSDIIDNLIKPSRDPRDSLPKPVLRSDILSIKDLRVNDKINGTVRNVVDFGCFVDIGLHNDALLHISKMSDKFIKHPSEILKVGDVISAFVSSIDESKEKVNLSLIEGK